MLSRPTALQAPRRPDSNSRKAMKAMIPRFVANWAVAMPNCNHLETRLIGETNCNFELFRIVWDSLEKYLLRILPRLPQSETVDNSAKTDFAPSIKVMSVNCSAKISLTPQKIATYNM